MVGARIEYLEGSWDWKSGKDFSHKTFPLGGSGLECEGRSGGKGTAGCLGRRETGRDDLIRCSGLECSGWGGGRVLGPSAQRFPPPHSRSLRRPRQGARHSDTLPPPRSFPSLPRAGRSIDGPLFAPPILCPPPPAGNRAKPPKTWSATALLRTQHSGPFCWHSGAFSRRAPLPPRPAEPRRVQSPRGRRVPPPRPRPPGAQDPRASSLLPSLRERRGRG